MRLIVALSIQSSTPLARTLTVASHLGDTTRLASLRYATAIVLAVTTVSTINA
jgi:hypothetical protein